MHLLNAEEPKNQGIAFFFYSPLICYIEKSLRTKELPFFLVLFRYATLIFVGGKSAKSTLKSDRRRSARRSVSFCSPLPEKDKSSSLRQPPTPHRSLGKQTQNYISLVYEYLIGLFL